MSERQMLMLRCAVNVARCGDIRSVGVLRARMVRLYPDASDDIAAAIRFWAKYEASKPS